MHPWCFYMNYISYLLKTALLFFLLVVVVFILPAAVTQYFPLRDQLSIYHYLGLKRNNSQTIPLIYLFYCNFTLKFTVDSKPGTFFFSSTEGGTNNNTSCQHDQKLFYWLWEQTSCACQIRHHADIRPVLEATTQPRWSHTGDRQAWGIKIKIHM